MPWISDVDAPPDAGVGVPATPAAGVMPALEQIGEAAGRVLTRRATARRVGVTLGGHGVVFNRPLSHIGSFTYAGEREWFTGELAITFEHGSGTELRFLANCVGRHVGSQLAVIQSVGTFAGDESMSRVGEMIVAEITVARETTYEARFYRLTPASSARQVPNARMRALGGVITVH